MASRENERERPVNSIAALQMMTYEQRLRERLAGKYSTSTPAEARSLEEQIQKLVRIYAEGLAVSKKMGKGTLKVHYMNGIQVAQPLWR